MSGDYVPAPGHIVWLHFDPRVGHEQGGRRPALVLSPSSYNSRTGMMVCCPLTTRIKSYPFEVPVAGEPRCVVLADQVKSQDWRARRAAFKGKVTEAELLAVRIKVRAIIG